MLGRRTNVIGPRRLLFRYCTEGNFALQPSRRRASCPTLLARGSNKNRIIAIIIIIMIIIIILSIVIVTTEVLAQGYGCEEALWDHFGPEAGAKWSQYSNMPPRPPC